MQRINQDIKAGTFAQIYLLYGEEAYLRKQYKDKLVAALSTDGDTMNTHLYRGKDINVGEIIDLAETMPFLAERRVIVLEDSNLLKSGGEQLAEYVAGIAPTAFFVLCESEIDKRSKLYKAIQAKGYAAEFANQNEDTLKRWIATILKQENKQITLSDVEYFLEKTGTDMANIRTELEKVICYAIERDVVTRADIDAICTTRISNHIFDMVTAMGEKDQKKALSLYYDLLALKEAPMRILYLIARQYNMLMQVKSLKGKGFDNRSIGEKIALPAFVAGKYVALAAHYKMSELKELVVKCVEAEEAVKTGRMNEMMSVETVIMCAC